jgi:hypothetical protein
MNAYPDARWVALRFRFAFIDQRAREDATPSSSAQHEASQLGQVLDEADQPDGAFVCLEHNRWGLGQKFTFIPRDISHTETGWINSTMSRADCTFASNPYLDFEFMEPHSSIGFSIHFDEPTGQHATRIRVQTYDENGQIIDDVIKENHSALCVINLLSPDYTHVRFTFLETSRPYSRVRVSEVLFGIVETYEADDIVTASLEYSVDPIAESLPSRQTVFRIDNSDQRFNLINPDGIYAYLQQPQSFDVAMGVGESKDTIEYVSMGQFYFATASAEDASLTAEITAYDWFYWLEKANYKCTSTGEWTLGEAITSIFTTVGIECEIVISAAAASTPIMKYTEEMTCREALRLAVQAACCTAYFNRESQLVVLDLAQALPVDALNNDNMSAPPKVTIESAVNAVQLTVRNSGSSEDVVYTAANIPDGAIAQVKSVNNNMVHEDMGQAVADWILQRCQGRITYTTAERGNPATLLTDTVKIYDYFHVNRNTVVTRQVFTYDGGLHVESEAIARGST